MIFVVSIIVIFIGISVFFFYRAEGLQRQLIKIKREISLGKKENQALAETVILVFNQSEAFAKQRLQGLKDKKIAAKEDLQDIELITPLINNYALICQESLKGEGRVSKVVNKCYVSIEADGYKNFKRYIDKQDDNTQRLWLSNSFKGYISLVERLLVKYENTAKDTLPVENIQIQPQPKGTVQ